MPFATPLSAAVPRIDTNHGSVVGGPRGICWGFILLPAILQTRTLGCKQRAGRLMKLPAYILCELLER